MSQEKEKRNTFGEGEVIMIDKPLHWTSFDVVKKIRALTGAKTGHAGTLDPLATGLLICCTGKLTREISRYQAQEKEYTGEITLGAVTPTYDLESEPRDHRPFEHLTEEEIRAAADSFVGDQLQSPPAHSAVKIGGKPVYHLARKGIEVVPEPRKIMIREFAVTGMALPRVSFRVVCSTGTYIRSLANDFGKRLGCGAYLSALKRTRIGDFTLSQAVSIRDFEQGIRSMRESQ